MRIAALGRRFFFVQFFTKRFYNVQLTRFTRPLAATGVCVDDLDVRRRPIQLDCKCFAQHNDSSDESHYASEPTSLIVVRLRGGPRDADLFQLTRVGFTTYPSVCHFQSELA